MTRRETRLRAEVRRLRMMLRLLFPYVHPQPGAEDLLAVYEREIMRIVYLDRERTARTIAGGRTLIH